MDVLLNTDFVHGTAELALRSAKALERIADALEARNAIDGQMAEFAELLQQGAPQVAHEGHPDLAPDGQPWGKR